MIEEYYIIQKKTAPSIYYRVKNVPNSKQQHRGGYRKYFVEVSNINQATKFKSKADVKESLEKFFSGKLKSHMTDMSGGVNIIHRKTVTTTTVTEIELDNSTKELISEIQDVSNMISETHYTAMELVDRLHNHGLTDYKFIMTTPYDKVKTSKLFTAFEQQGLEPFKHMSNFAFNKEEYITAARLLCDVPVKTYRLT